ncbi:MAG TPA: HNH endonuclease, partial [Candidatus Hodarchaeales archaeon]|nr:HNH endonuclease [Candidatus Hodarchaeales archaeon]
MPYLDRSKQQEFQREWLRRRRQEWIDEHGPCSLCGSDNEMEIHHLGSKVSHHVWSWSEERRKAELSKCVVLCGDCHQKETAKQRRLMIPHGSRTKYRYG